MIVKTSSISDKVFLKVNYSKKKKNEIHTCITCSVYNRNKHVKTGISYILYKNLIKVDKMAL